MKTFMVRCLRVIGAWANHKAVQLETTECTGVAASWCPIHGDCREVSGGCVVQRGQSWLFEHRCARNTEWARHFRGACDADCRPCRQIAVLRPFARPAA